MPYPKTNLSESGILRYGMTKTKYRNKLDREADLRLQLSPIISSTLQAWKGPEGSRRLRFPDFKTIGTRR